MLRNNYNKSREIAHCRLEFSTGLSRQSIRLCLCHYLDRGTVGLAEVGPLCRLWPEDKCQWNFGRASGKFGVILVKLIDYSGKLPSGPVGKNLKFAACDIAR